MDHPDIRRLQAPPEDGQCLLWPESRLWAELASRAADRLAGRSECRLLGTPLDQVRASARRAILPAAAGPWIVTGHQTYPYHPGIWFKDAAADALAGRLGGTAVHLGVDHDLPHPGPQLVWPAVDESGRIVRRGALQLGHSQPFERQPPPDRAALAEVSDKIRRDLDGLLAQPVSLCDLDASGNNFAEWFERVRSRLDERLGLRTASMAVSRLARSEAFALFAADAMARAEQLHETYNSAADEVGRALGRRPAAPLDRRGEAIELPFWTLRADAASRGRLFVARQGRSLVLSDDRGPIGSTCPEPASLGDTLKRANVELRPRALTLTLFVRMVLADLFIHGLGGARYDLAAEAIMRRHYRLDPPPMAVATATLRLPIESAVAGLDDLRAARLAVRDFEFNPQRNLPADVLASPSAQRMLAQRQAAVAGNDALRADESRRRDRLARTEFFAAVRTLNESLARLGDEELARRRQRLATLAEQYRTAQVVEARDYFYGLFDPHRLGELRDRARAEIGN